MSLLLCDNWKGQLTLKRGQKGCTRVQHSNIEMYWFVWNTAWMLKSGNKAGDGEQQVSRSERRPSSHPETFKHVFSFISNKSQSVLAARRQPLRAYMKPRGTGGNLQCYYHIIWDLLFCLQLALRYRQAWQLATFFYLLSKDGKHTEWKPLLLYHPQFNIKWQTKGEFGFLIFPDGEVRRSLKTESKQEISEVQFLMCNATHQSLQERQWKRRDWGKKTKQSLQSWNQTVIMSLQLKLTTILTVN